MKFLTKINLQYFWTLTILLILLTVAGYFVLQRILTNEMNEDIFEKEYAIIKEIKTTGRLPNIYPIIETKKISSAEVQPKSEKEMFLMDEAEDEEEPYIEYTNSVIIDNQYYLIKIRHSLLESNDLLMAIALPLLVLLVLAFLISFFITKKLTKTVWKDFEQNLKEIENFSFSNSEPLLLKQTNIEEFDRLNKTVQFLTSKLQKDYQALKEFSENASHEIQTPLSIILLNLEELLQQNLSEEAFKKVVSAINNVKRLSNLNQSLLLLTKIENKQFQMKRSVNLVQVIKTKMEDFAPLFQKEKLDVTLKQSGIFLVKMDDVLAGILINNLLSNALKHNISGGKIMIDVNENKLKFCNTGAASSLTNENIFNRFTKENSQSYGLGLAIVKQICDNHHLQIIYSQNEMHCFEMNKLNIKTDDTKQLH